MINVISNMLSLIFPSVIQILETFKCTFKSILSVCSGLDNTCYDISDSVIISVNYLNKRLNKLSTFEINSFILETPTLKCSNRSEHERL